MAHEPDDVADVVRVLRSDESRWITGPTIAVGCGHRLRRGPDRTRPVELLDDPATLDPTGRAPR